MDDYPSKTLHVGWKSHHLWNGKKFNLREESEVDELDYLHKMDKSRTILVTSFKFIFFKIEALINLNKKRLQMMT